MGILQRIKQSFLAARGGFEMSSSNGLPVRLQRKWDLSALKLRDSLSRC